MSTTPLWVPLVVAGIGVAGTLVAGIAGALVAQRWANQRDDKTWAREREREQERWRREDEARTFEHRREAFEQCYQAIKALGRRAYDHGYGFDRTPVLPPDWHADAAAKLTRLGIYADRSRGWIQIITERPGGPAGCPETSSSPWPRKNTSPDRPPGRTHGPVTGSCSTPTGWSKAVTITGTSSQDQIATALLAGDCDQALDTLMTAVHQHTGGHIRQL